MTAAIMKRLLCTFFIVLTYTILAGSAAPRKASLNEMLRFATHLQNIGQNTRGPLLTPVNIELDCSLRYFERGLKELRTKCKDIGSDQQSCKTYIRVIIRDMKLWKSEKCPECEYEQKNFTDFMSHLISFLQKKLKE